ncbi:MAG: efflux RND transporter permease subunit [Planctomycetota bacterium]
MIRNQAGAQFFFDRILLRHPKIIILLILAVVVILGLGARNFRLDASAETLVLENDESLRYTREISARYGQHDLLVLTYKPKGDLLSDETLANLKRLSEELEGLERVHSVNSILNVPLVESPPVALKELTANLPTLGSGEVDKEMARRELGSSGLYKNLLVSSGLQITAIMINFANDEVYYELRDKRNELRGKKAQGTLTSVEKSELKRLSEEFKEHWDQMRQLRHEDIAQIRNIMEKYNDEAELFLGGVSMIADDMITFIKNDLKVFGTGVFLLLVLMLGIIFGRLRWICIPMLCCTISAICMFGLLGWMRWDVTVVSSNFISLQLIMTLAITIHLIVRYRELLHKNPERDNIELIGETLRLKLKPCIYAVLTTIAGFGSLVFCDILPVINFGWMMIAGLTVSLIVTFLVFPTVLILSVKERIRGKQKWYFPLTTILARFTEKHGIFIVGISILVTILSLVGISRLEVENSFIDYFKKDTEIYQGMKVIDESLGGTTPLDVVVRFEDSEEEFITDEVIEEEVDEIFEEFEEFEEQASDAKYWFTADKMGRIKNVHHYLDSQPETGKVVSLATMLNIVEKLNNNKPLDSLELALLYNETPDEFKTILIKPYVSVENNEVRFWLRIRDSEKGLRRNALLNKIQSDLQEILGLDKEHINLAGMLVLYNNMLQSLFGSQIVTLGITVLILMGMFGVLFRSLKVALIAIFPNVLSITVVLGVMGWMKVPLDMMTITIAAIGVGIAVDDTIHYIHRFREEFQKDRNYLQTMHRCHGSIGHAMYYTSVTIIIGFSILALSNFIPTIYFGLLTGLAMLIALVSALTLLPEMLILLKPFGKEDLRVNDKNDDKY